MFFFVKTAVSDFTHTKVGIFTDNKNRCAPDLQRFNLYYYRANVNKAKNKALR
jgi:hypothetical protein